MLLIFLLGVVVGCSIGIIIMAMLNAATYADMINEIKEMLDKM